MGFGKPQRAQRTQRKQQLSVPSASSVVNLLCHNPPHPEEIKKPRICATRTVKEPQKRERRKDAMAQRTKVLLLAIMLCGHRSLSCSWSDWSLQNPSVFTEKFDCVSLSTCAAKLIIPLATNYSIGVQRVAADRTLSKRVTNMRESGSHGKIEDRGV
jgi:hypothetical protein